MPAGQAQKEFFINLALCVLDALHMRAVAASLPSPPTSPAEGSCFRATAPATAAWAGHEDDLAAVIGGEWHFVTPAEGMQIYVQTAGQIVVYTSHWISPVTPPAPSGGAVVHAEARAAIGALVTALQLSGILGPTAP